jgi:hypothetical protein
MSPKLQPTWRRGWKPGGGPKFPDHQPLGELMSMAIREPILVRARKIFVLACTVQKHRNHLLSAPASCKFFALECAS